MTASTSGQPRGASPVSREEIVKAALSIIDREGFHTLSMRGLARKLVVYPTTLYWHAGTKAQLLALVSQRVLEEIDLPDEADYDWQQWMLILGKRVRKVLGAHPRFAAYFATNIQASTSSLTFVDKTLAVLEDAGFQGERLVNVYNALVGSIFGWISGEFAMEPEDDIGQMEADLRMQLGETDLETVRSNFPLLANRVFMMRWSSGTTSPMDSSFDLMLRSLLSGLAAELDSNDPVNRSTDAS